MTVTLNIQSTSECSSEEASMTFEKENHQESASAVVGGASAAAATAACPAAAAAASNTSSETSSRDFSTPTEEVKVPAELPAAEAETAPTTAAALDPEPEKETDQAVAKVAPPTIDDFKILKVLGKGAYGKVFQVRKVSGPGGEGTVYAMKAMDKSRICGSKTDVRHTKAERKVLVSVDHPFIVKLKFAFETSKRLYLVQEFCPGGELFRRMEVERLMVESVAKFYLQEILLALEYLHSLDILYRDLKTENVMLDKEGHVKLIDFGLSKTDIADDKLTHTFCGTVEYMAPEVILKDPGYGKPADWWSFGVFTFDLLTGRSPFHSNQGKVVTKERILKAKFPQPKVMTPDANDFVRKLLRRPVERRLGSRRGAEELKSHPFFRQTDWEMVLERRYPPPFVPEVRNPEDVRNFDSAFTSQSPRESDTLQGASSTTKAAAEATSAAPSVVANSDNLFEEFDYVAQEFFPEEELAENESNETAIAAPSENDDDGKRPETEMTSSTTTSGVCSGSSSMSADSLNAADSQSANAADSQSATPTAKPTNVQEEEDLEADINDMRICNHGS